VIRQCFSCVTKVPTGHGFVSLACRFMCSAWTLGPWPMVACYIRHSLYSVADGKPSMRQVIRAYRWASGDVDALL